MVYLYLTIETNTMKNLINTLSKNLQSKIADFKVEVVFVEEGELNVRSYYTMDASYYEAIRKELQANGSL